MVIHKISIPRRTVLRGAGAALALPFLDAMTPAFADIAPRPTRIPRDDAGNRRDLEFSDGERLDVDLDRRSMPGPAVRRNG